MYRANLEMQILLEIPQDSHRMRESRLNNTIGKTRYYIFKALLKGDAFKDVECLFKCDGSCSVE